MRIETTFLRSKVAHRIFFLFVLCALIPIITLSIVSYTQVSKQLKDQGFNRLKNSAKVRNEINTAISRSEIIEILGELRT